MLEKDNRADSKQTSKCTETLRKNKFEKLRRVKFSNKPQQIARLSSTAVQLHVSQDREKCSGNMYNKLLVMADIIWKITWM